MARPETTTFGPECGTIGTGVWSGGPSEHKFGKTYRIASHQGKPLLPEWLVRDMGSPMRLRVNGELEAMLLATSLITVQAHAANAAPPVTSTQDLQSGPTRDAARPRDPAVDAIEKWVLGVSQAKLENGLRVVMAPDSESPTVSVCVTYDVGSRNEGPGQSGFAHLFEHMMFQGSRNVAKGEHFQLVTARGGQLNGTTSTDRTNYFETLPSNELELALWLEADRMRWLDVSEPNFENQRSVVKEEYRMRVENAAYRPALIELERLVFEGYAPYEHPTIGSMADLDAAKLEWVRAFHQHYYAPNNAVLSISGGFDADQAMMLVRKYFGPIPTATVLPFVEPPIPALRSTERRATVPDVNAKTEALMLGWRIPPSRHKDHYALEMAARVLADGESATLYEKLVRKRPLARDVSAYTYDHRGPDALVISVELNSATKIADVTGVIDQELHHLTVDGPTEEALARARQRVKSSFIFGLQANQARATLLGEYATFFGDPRLIGRDLEALLRVSTSDVREAVRQHMAPNARSVIVVQPSRPKPAPTPQAPAQSSEESR
ncbi:MAG TPA: pitrilysin family protein [Polyangiaceae bacterium]